MGQKYCHVDGNLNIGSEVHGRVKDKGKLFTLTWWNTTGLGSLRKKAILEMVRHRKSKCPTGDTLSLDLESWLKFLSIKEAEVLKGGVLNSQGHKSKINI